MQVKEEGKGRGDKDRRVEKTAQKDLLRMGRTKDRLVVLTDHLERGSCPLCMVGWGVGDVKL